MEDWVMAKAEEGKTLEVDESKFGRRKYNHGHVVDGQWVFSGVERGSVHLFLVQVKDRKSETLLAIIKDFVRDHNRFRLLEGGDAFLEENDYKHLTVNHSVNFKDPETGAHTNTIESTWQHVKNFVPQYNKWKNNFHGYTGQYRFNNPFIPFLKETGKIDYKL